MLEIVMSSLQSTEHPDPNGARRPDGQPASRKLPGPTIRTLFPRLAICAGVLAALGYVIFLPVRLPSTVNTYATIAPAQKWVLSKAVDGQLIGCLSNLKSGMSEGYRVSTFNAGSSIYFSLHSSLQPGRPIAVGDTVGSVYSTEVQERMIALQGQLAAARSLLAVTSTGQKVAIVKEAEQRLQFAQRRSAEHQRVEARTQKLFDGHLIAEGEYDRVQSEANALRDEITIAAANLEGARTGAKPEQLDLANANIAALQGEFDAVKRRAATYIVTAPISGTVLPSFSSDTLLTIAATEYIALLPVKCSDYARLAATTRPRLTITGIARNPVQGTLIAINREVLLLHGQECVIATALLDAPPPEVMRGMLVRCRIDCTPVTAVECGRQFLATFTASQPLMGGF